MTICRSISALLFLFTIAGHAYSDDHQLPGRVLRVIDGDSLILDVRGSHYRIELADIDAPELNQPWGRAAADWLHRSLTGSFAVVHWTGKVDDHQVVGKLISRNRDIALELLHEGLAWCSQGVVTEFPDQGRPYREAEAGARQAHRGLWSDEQAIPPWEWRTQHPGTF
jgi:endonuclease YncB( thermonuclease family)